MSEGKKIRKTRTLAEDERALWRAATRSVAPLRHAARLEMDGAVPALAPEPPHRPSKANNVAAQIKQKPQPPSVPPLAPIDRRLRQRLSRGSEPIEARIDLHGMTQNAAHHALARFLHRAQASGARNVLVITGKGMSDPHSDPAATRGVLRRQVPLWLRLPELRAIVMGFEPAHVSHGGEGALYVRLRRAGRT